MLTGFTFKKSVGGRGLILMSVKDSINSDMNSGMLIVATAPCLWRCTRKWF